MYSSLEKGTLRAIGRGMQQCLCDGLGVGLGVGVGGWRLGNEGKESERNQKTKS